MPTDIYIGDIPIEQAFLGDDPIEMDDNNGCRGCAAYTIRKDSGYPGPSTWVSASNCYTGETFVLNIASTVNRSFFASNIIAVGAGAVFGGGGSLTDAQGKNACKNAYGKEEYLPCESWTFTNLAIASFNMIGYKPCNGDYTQGLMNLNGFAGDTVTVCLTSGSLYSLVSSSYNGPC
jgi:hypothetical protein